MTLISQRLMLRSSMTCALLTSRSSSLDMVPLQEHDLPRPDLHGLACSHDGKESNGGICLGLLDAVDSCFN